MKPRPARSTQRDLISILKLFSKLKDVASTHVVYAVAIVLRDSILVASVFQTAERTGKIMPTFSISTKPENSVQISYFYNIQKKIPFHII